MKKTNVALMMLGVLSVLIFVVSISKREENVLKAAEMPVSSANSPQKIDTLSEQLTKEIRADINDTWPGQTMMEDEFQLSDGGWEMLSIKNTAESLVIFPISVEGFEDGTLIGHIRFGGVKADGNFDTDTAKELRNLVFVVENTKKFVGDKEANDPTRVTFKYTYNYYQANNNTYTMVPITDMAHPGMEHTLSNDRGLAFEIPRSGSTIAHRKVKELYIQEIPGADTYAVQARTDQGQGTNNLDFYFQQCKTLIPTPEGGVRIVNEVKNTGWRTGQENKFPRKTFGAIIGEDTMLNDVDSVPIFSLGTNKGVYIANNKDLFRVAFPRLLANQGAADNYEGQSYNSIFATGTGAAFQKKPDGYGNEGQKLPLDTQVLPANGIKPPPKNPALGQGYDTQFVQKWNPRQPPEKDEKAIMSYDVNVLPIYKPEIKLAEESLDQSAHKDSLMTFKGTWRDLDSLHVTLYYQIESRKNEGWIEFKKDSREDTDEHQDKWFPFELELPASKFKLNGDSISFRAVDTTDVKSDTADTTVNTFETVTITTEHYRPDGQQIEKKSVLATPGQGNTYTTSPNDYSAQGLTFDASKTVGKPSGDVPTHDVLVKYYYKEGVVTVMTHYLKEDDTKLFPSDKTSYKYNQTYTTDDRAAEAKALDYYVKTTTGETTGPTGTVDQTLEVTYTYRIGQLGILEVPETLDFGSHRLITLGEKDIYPTTDTTVKIVDELSSDWDLHLRIKDQLVTGNKPLKGDLYFNTKELGPIKLNQDGQNIHSREDVKAGAISLTWDQTKKEGLYFKQLTGNQTGDYKGTLEWNIVLAP